MTTRSARHAVLSETATFDERTGELRVVIETPKGSRNKYDYDPDCDCLELATVLPEGMSFPYDFGFVPSTLGEDGEPLDVLVLMDEIQEFFIAYNRLRGRKFRPLALTGPGKSRELIKAGMDAFKKRKHQRIELA